MINADYTWNPAYVANLTGAGGGLYFDGPNAVAAYGGLVPLFTPNPWESGTSVVHFDPDGDMSPRKLFNTVGLRVEGGRLVFNVGSPTGTAYIDVYVYGVDPKGVGR